jgi:hypothetical protein
VSVWAPRAFARSTCRHPRSMRYWRKRSPKDRGSGSEMGQRRGTARVSSTGREFSGCLQSRTARATAWRSERGGGGIPRRTTSLGESGHFELEASRPEPLTPNSPVEYEASTPMHLNRYRLLTLPSISNLCNTPSLLAPSGRATSTPTIPYAPPSPVPDAHSDGSSTLYAHPPALLTPTSIHTNYTATYSSSTPLARGHFQQQRPAVGLPLASVFRR